MTKQSFGWAIVAVAAGLGLAGCGDTAADDQNGTSQQELADPKAPPKVTYPAYIVYVQPDPKVNPLFKDVQTFIAAHDSGSNQAAAYPPHLSITGFFNTALTETALRQGLKQAVKDISTPFGQPLVQPKAADNPKTSPVYCERGTRTITLHVRLPNKYYQFRADVTKRLGAGEHAKGTSHITLFEATDKNLPQATFDTICAAARSTFNDARIDGYNRTTDGHPFWDATLFLAPTHPTPAHPLDQSANAVETVQVNP